MVHHMITRRRALQLGALGGVAMAATPLRFALAASEPFKIGSVGSLTGPGAPVGKMGLVGVQMAVDRINKNGGIKGRPVKLLAEDDESKPDVGRRKAEKLLTEDQIDDAHVGGAVVEYLPRLHAGLRGPSGRQHDLGLPRHDDHHQQMQPLFFPALRLRAGPGGRGGARIWSTSSARSGTSSMPTIPGANRPATPTPPRSRRTAARWSARPGFRSIRPT